MLQSINPIFTINLFSYIILAGVTKLPMYTIIVLIRIKI